MDLTPPPPLGNPSFSLSGFFLITHSTDVRFVDTNVYKRYGSFKTDVKMLI